MSQAGSTPVKPISPVLQPGQTHTFIGRAIAWLKGEVSAGWKAITDFVTHEAFPFVERTFATIAMDVQAKLAPAAKEFIDAQPPAFAALLSKGWEGFLEVEGALFVHLMQHAETAVQDATITDIRIAAHSAALNLEAATKGTGA